MDTTLVGLAGVVVGAIIGGLAQVLAEWFRQRGHRRHEMLMLRRARYAEMFEITGNLRVGLVVVILKARRAETYAKRQDEAGQRMFKEVYAELNEHRREMEGNVTRLHSAIPNARSLGIPIPDGYGPGLAKKVEAAIATQDDAPATDALTELEQELIAIAKCDLIPVPVGKRIAAMFRR